MDIRTKIQKLLDKPYRNFKILLSKELYLDQLNDPNSTVIVVQTLNSRYVIAVFDKQTSTIAYGKPSELDRTIKCHLYGSTNDKGQFKSRTIRVGMQLIFEKNKIPTTTSKVISIGTIDDLQVANSLRDYAR